MTAPRVWSVRRLRRARARLTSRCPSVSGSLYGYRCELVGRHRGRRHRCTTSVTTTERFGRSYESARSVVEW